MTATEIDPTVIVHAREGCFLYWIHIKSRCIAKPFHSHCLLVEPVPQGHARGQAVNMPSRSFVIFAELFRTRPERIVSAPDLFA